MDIKFEFDNIDEFYKECMLCTTDKRKHTNHIKEDKREFRGLSLEDIKQYMYGYTPGIEKLEQIEDSFAGLGSSMYTYIWNDMDGEEMDMVRAYEGMPYLSQKRRTHGNGAGKFVTINVIISENASVSASKMLNKTYTAASLVTKLETLGYRVKVNAVAYSYDTGSYDYGNSRGGIKAINFSEIVIPVKKFEEPLNISLLLNAISPWFFRYWIFLFYYAKYYTSWGLGQSRLYNKKDTKKEITIDNGECLTKEASLEKIKKITKIFLTEDEDDKV